MDENKKVDVWDDEEDMLLADHGFDGIRELDNDLPPWWVWMFYICILFAGIYLVRYHVLKSAPLQAEEYQIEMKMAEANKPKSDLDENNIVLLTAEADIAAGLDIYTKNCVACHKADGGGLVGPNLTDDAWIHGGTNEDVYRTIKLGVPAKGMISWKDQLSAKQMLQVTSYMLTKLYGTTPGAGAKAAEGKEHKRQ